MAWISKNSYLSLSEMQNNAKEAYGVLNSLGYSFNTICALLGNMQRESTLSPILEERGGGGGYGLLQWTPKSDLTSACSKLGLSPYTDGTIQLRCLDGELFTLGGQWYSTRAFISKYYSSGASADMIGLTPTQFKTNSLNKDPGWLSVAFMACYERPGYKIEVNRADLRKSYANYWYQFLSGMTPPDPGPIPDPPHGLSAHDIWFLYAGTEDFLQGR